MSLSFEQIVVDCADAATLAEFWSAVLDTPVDGGANEFFATVGRTGDAPLRPAFMFVKVPEERAGKNRLHVDLVSAEWRAEIDRVIGLGAKHVARVRRVRHEVGEPAGPRRERLRHRRRQVRGVTQLTRQARAGPLGSGQVTSASA
jgi:hypothetical protein